METLSATPGQLVVMLYDHLLVCLRRAHAAAQAGDIEVRVEMLDKSRAVLGELLSTLDQEKGGDVARQLSSLYAFLLCELIDQGLRPDLARLHRVTRIVDELRDAWATIAAQAQSSVTAPALAVNA